MADWEYLDVSRQGRVVTVTFDTGSTVNSLNMALLGELAAFADALQQDSEISAVVLTGRPETFTGGMDLNEAQTAATTSLSRAQRRTLLKLGPDMCAAWEALDAVTIVAIEGWCVGGGVALAAACDWRVAASDARLLVPELKLGMNMSWQSVPRLVNLIGPARTKQLLLLAEPQGADTAQQWGLVDFITGNGGALQRAQALAEQVAQLPPLPLRMTKRAITSAATVLNQVSSHMDLDQFLALQDSDDAREGLAAFLEKRPAKFRGN